jgi:hypothetical protein
MQEHLQLIDDCEARESRLTDWERGFMDTTRNQIGKGRALTEKQAERLQKIWDRVTAKG